MSDLGDLGDLWGTIGSMGAAAYARGQILGRAARIGMSGRAALRALRGAGIGVGSSSFWPAWRQIRQQMAINAQASALPVDYTTGELLAAEAPPGWTGRYVHQVTAQFRHRTEAGETAIQSRTLGVVSNVPLSPSEAVRAAMDIIETPTDSDSPTGYPVASQILTMALTGAWYQTRPGLAE
ncbi:hypothetical protein [Mycobacterium sp.]|uniref:hypothetical protein n=1 Tax=Mycobacterium sp. TaxID=1785 RepID=UPI0031D55CE0